MCSWFQNSRGRIYVETTDTFKVFELLKGFQPVSWRSMYVVPIHEREQLLFTVRSRKVIKVNGWVRIRCGLYRRDIAQVQDFDENEEFYNLKVVPRIKPPVPTTRLGKRARIRTDRPTPQRLRKADAISKYGKNSVKTRDEGFEFKSHFYDKDGLRLIRLRHDAIVRISPTMEQIQLFMDAAIERIQIDHPQPENVTANTYNDQDVFASGKIDINDLRPRTLLECRNRSSGSRRRTGRFDRTNSCHFNKTNGYDINNDAYRREQRDNRGGSKHARRTPAVQCW